MCVCVHVCKYVMRTLSIFFLNHIGLNGRLVVPNLVDLAIVSILSF